LGESVGCSQGKGKLRKEGGKEGREMEGGLTTPRAPLTKYSIPKGI